MAIPVLIIGKSGMGKSASLRNCAGNPDWNLIRVLNKPLPFKGKIDGWNTDDYQTVMKWTPILTFVALILHMFFDTGILAIVMPSVIWLVTSVTYCRACLQNKGEKLSK